MTETDYHSISVVINQLILSMYEYNKRMQFRDPSDNQSFYAKGRVESLMDCLKALGYPVTYGYGAVWSSGKSKYINGYGYITFSKNLKELEESGIHTAHGFENGIFWFVDGRGIPTIYRGGC